MELQGKVIAVLPERSGVSARGEWKSQSFVIETHEQYPKKLVFDVFGADRLAQFNIQSGEEINVSFDIDAHEYNGRWFNNDRVWSCDAVCHAQREKERRAVMKEFLCDSVFFGVAISILAYELGVFLKKKLKLAVFNPLLISIVAVIVFLVAFHIPYESYNEGAKYLSYLLTPATVCLAIPLYEQFELLKQNVAAIFAGLTPGFPRISSVTVV